MMPTTLTMTNANDDVEIDEDVDDNEEDDDDDDESEDDVDDNDRDDDDHQRPPWKSRLVLRDVPTDHSITFPLSRSLCRVPSVAFPQSRARRAIQPTVSRQPRRHTSRVTTRLLVSL